MLILLTFEFFLVIVLNLKFIIVDNVVDNIIVTNTINKMGDNVIDKLNEILKRNYNVGLTITELVKISKLSFYNRFG